MHSNRINYLIVGSFVILMVIALVFSIALLTGRTGASDGYHTYYTNVTGVKFGTQVVYEGYPIGQVTEITPEPAEGRMRFRVDFDVLEGWQIPVDSEVTVAAPGLLAAVTLSIEAGQAVEALEPGDLVVSAESKDLFSVMANVAEKATQLADENLIPLLANLNEGAESLNRILGSEGEIFAKDLVLLVQDANDVIVDLAARIPDLGTQAKQVLGDLQLASAEVRKLATPETRELVTRTVSNMEQASAEAEQAMEMAAKVLTQVDQLVSSESGDIRATVRETRYVVESLARRIDTINENIEGVSRNMLEFTRQIRQNPGLLLSSPTVDDEVVAGGPN